MAVLSGRRQKIPSQSCQKVQRLGTQGPIERTRNVLSQYLINKGPSKAFGIVGMSEISSQYFQKVRVNTFADGPHPLFSQSTCANTNRFLDSVAWRCPGFETYNDVFNDRNFNCDGHKGRYWNSHSECRQARAAYEKSIEEKRCQFTSNIPSVSTCKEAFNSVSFGDKEQGITKEIMDHSRDPNGVYNNIVEFQRAFYEDSDSASGASAK